MTDQENRLAAIVAAAQDYQASPYHLALIATEFGHDKTLINWVGSKAYYHAEQQLAVYNKYHWQAFEHLKERLAFLAKSRAGKITNEQAQKVLKQAFAHVPLPLYTCLTTPEARVFAEELPMQTPTSLPIPTQAKKPEIVLEKVLHVVANYYQNIPVDELKNSKTTNTLVLAARNVVLYFVKNLLPKNKQSSAARTMQVREGRMAEIVKTVAQEALTDKNFSAQLADLEFRIKS